MEGRRGPAIAAELSPVDRIYLARAVELARRGDGSTAPNPSVGAVLVRGTQTLGEGFHRVRGSAHAEVDALADAARRGADVRGATAYVTLEPCDHTGLTPPCTRALLDAGVSRVVIGALDPDLRTEGAGVVRLEKAGVRVDVAHDPSSAALIEAFDRFARRHRPFVRLKLAMSRDGYMAPKPGVKYWLTGDAAREYVRELRATHDAVMVGAGTVRVDDPQLTVRPPRSRRKPSVRVVACEDAPVPADRAIFADVDGYARTIVLAPAGKRDAFAPLEAIADVAYVGDGESVTLDLERALDALRDRGVATVLCEGGPTLATRLLERRLVDRADWIVAPVSLAGPEAVRVLLNPALVPSIDTAHTTPLGDDVLISEAYEVLG